MFLIEAFESYCDVSLIALGRRNASIVKYYGTVGALHGSEFAVNGSSSVKIVNNIVCFQMVEHSSLTQTPQGSQSGFINRLQSLSLPPPPFPFFFMNSPRFQGGFAPSVQL